MTEENQQTTDLAALAGELHKLDNEHYSLFTLVVNLGNRIAALDERVIAMAETATEKDEYRCWCGCTNPFHIPFTPQKREEFDEWMKARTEADEATAKAEDARAADNPECRNQRCEQLRIECEWLRRIVEIAAPSDEHCDSSPYDIDVAL